MKLLLLSILALALTLSAHADSPAPQPSAAAAVPGDRVASIYISQDFINEQLSQHVKSDLIQGLKIALDPESGNIVLHGTAQIPLDELRAINLDPRMGKFRFQLTAKLATTRHGHLIIEFPLNKTFFYPADSKTPKQDRVIVPVQMLSIALASTRGYLAALSGDFGGFDRRTAKLEALLKALDRSIAGEKNADALDDLKTQRESLHLQLAAVPLERKQLQSLAKEFSTMLGFTGEKELNLNDELAAKKNALVLKIKISQFAPYLEGVELGGVRIRLDKKDGAGQNYLAIDVNALVEGPIAEPIVSKPSGRAPMKTAPSLILRLNQSLFESKAVVDAEKKEMGSSLKNFDLQLEEDGLHVSGKWHTLLFFSVPFDTIVDFVSTDVDVFEARVREIKIAGIDVDFLTKFVLESLKKRLNHSLKGLCKFKYVGEKDNARALQVRINPKELIPAFPDLHLVNVDVRSREFLLKIGKQ